MKNKKGRLRTVWITFLAVALAALLLVIACAPSEEAPQIERKVIEIGDIGALTGPGSSADQLCLMATLDYARYFNEEEIIPGVTVEIIWRDSARSVERWLSAYNRLLERGSPLIISKDTAGIVASQSSLEEDKMPLFCGNPVEEVVYPPHWYYFINPTWSEQFGVLAEYIMENWQEERPPKLAFMAIDSSFGRQIEVTGTEYAQSIGIEMLPIEIVPFVVLDATTQLLRLKERGADFAYISGLMVTAGPILRDAERLGLAGTIHFSGLDMTAGAKLIEMTGAASEGYLIPRTYPSIYESEVAGIKLMRDTQMKYHGKLVEEPEYVLGWLEAAIPFEAVRRAVSNVGYENLDGTAIKEEFDSIKDFDVDGLVNITYTPDDHTGSSKVAIYQIRGDEIIRVSDWREAPMLVP